MDAKTRSILREAPNLRAYVRYHPKWYRYLSRNPEKLEELEKEAKQYYGKTISQRVKKIGDDLQMLKLFADLAKEMTNDA